LVFTGDTWWQIAVGEEVLRTATLPTVDSYSFTVTDSDWIAYHWLADVLMALAARAGGLPALMGLLLVLAALLLLLLYYYTYLRCENPKAAFLACLLLLPVIAVSINLRPQLLGYIFLLVTLIFLERFRQRCQKSLWILPLVFLVWVNTHGTFLLGLLVLGLYWASGLVEFQRCFLEAHRWGPSQRRHLTVILLLCVLALIATPYGTQLAAYPLQIAFLQPVNVGAIEEWQPLPLDFVWAKLILGLLLLFFLAQLHSPLTWRLGEVGLLLFSIYATFVHQRMALLLVLAFTPPLAVVLTQRFFHYQAPKDRPALNVALLLLIGLLLVGLFPSRAELEAAVAWQYPRGAVEYLRQHGPPERMFALVEWGGYLTWSLGPEHKVFIDTRLDVYEYAGVFSDYMEIASVGPRVLFLLEKYEVRACLVQRTTSLATLLAELPEWEQIYADELSSLYVHRSGHEGERK
jgi:hypothetical protein